MKALTLAVPISHEDGKEVPIQAEAPKSIVTINGLILACPCLFQLASPCLAIFHFHVRNGPVPSDGLATSDLAARVKYKAFRKIICSAISSSGTFFFPTL
ncbi:unnamed protein product [Fraxinus pennsylvanica]|uniref:Uncharacterized protein n=1 Tax=Fraxinus pennsylvanica TaxID=56036 RepID=A0AAD1Z4J5_9LAMI|nr:unnamed protein product [Fraxinus pennsylvanica]